MASFSREVPTSHDTGITGRKTAGLKKWVITAKVILNGMGLPRKSDTASSLPRSVIATDEYGLFYFGVEILQEILI